MIKFINELDLKKKARLRDGSHWYEDVFISFAVLWSIHSRVSSYCAPQLTIFISEFGSIFLTLDHLPTTFEREIWSRRTNVQLLDHEDSSLFARLAPSVDAGEAITRSDIHLVVAPADV